MSDSLFFLFGGDRFYPAGGVGDLVGTFTTIEAAQEAATGDVKRPWDNEGETSTLEWWHIATVHNGEIRILAMGTGVSARAS